MKLKYTKYLLLYLFAFTASIAMAFSPDFYAKESRLASGHWVKVSVPESGLYSISAAQLRQWGFSDPSAVRVYGYGGAQISDILSEKNYIDDLPLVQCASSGEGIVFYGVGPEKWNRSANGTWVNNANFYTSVGYYFLSDTDEPLREIEAQAMAEAPASPATTYTARVHYELDRTSPGEAGYLLVGESFKAQPTRKFKLDAPAGRVALEVGIVSNTSFTSSIEITANGEKLPQNSSSKISTTSSSHYVHASYTTAAHQFENPADGLDLTISVANATSMKDCWLDYIAASVETPLVLPASQAISFVAGPYCQLGLGSAASATVWDVTDPLNITAVNTIGGDGALAWTNDYTGDRAYAAFAPGAKLPSPTFVGNVRNQNLHAQPCVDMVIFTLPELKVQAERIADMHRTADVHPLSVAVLDVNDVYNEFASGSPDVSALRKCLKMLYDRGTDGVEGDTLGLPAVKYALLLGRSTYDNRRLTAQFDSPSAHGTVPCWMGGTRSQQLSDNTGFNTDDFIAMLADNSGVNLGLDDLCVAVGRMPATSASEAKSMVDKLVQYVEKSKTGTWKNSFLVLADDGNDGVHVDQAEDMIRHMLNGDNSQVFVSKVYVDAYDIIGGSCEGGRADMYRMLDEGVMWWQFIGHANNHSWTGENMLNYNDINNMYLQRVPILMAATCDFLRWDSSTISGGEILYGERYGGVIAAISATRPVYISENALLTQAMGRALTHRDENGRLGRLGDVYSRAKNDLRDSKGNRVSNTNRLRYVLMGDPAMRIAMPDNTVRLDSIGAVAVTEENQATLQALQRTTVAGTVLRSTGEPYADFNGTVELVIYDAEHSNATKGVREENVVRIFEQHGNKLFAGSAPVKDGRFCINVAMPGEIANNFRPATMNFYAYSANDEAVGLSSDFYVYGFDESAPVDSVAPVIEEFYLNHPSFEDGARVNESPMAIARVSDDIGINLSSAGVGHQMALMLDGNISYSDVSLYYVPSIDGTPSGTINYPLENLSEGAHTLRLRVWDTSGNSATQEIAFNVRPGLTPTIYDIYCDANPASVETNFYISHDRPDGEVTVTIEVFNLMGRPVWSNSVTGRSDSFLSSPINWNLCDDGGRRVARGIYVYRAKITADGETYDTGTRKLAVTGY